MMLATKSKESRHERGRRHLDDAKLTTGCEWCGEMELCVLDFHHLHDKRFNLSGASCAKSLEALDEEVAKCAVLCANDHRRAHAGLIIIEQENDHAPNGSQGKPCYYAVGYRLYRARHAGN